MSLRLRRAVLGQIESHARASHPEECCGALIGRLPADFDRPGRAVEASEARRLANAWEAPARGRRYRVDAAALAALERELSGSGRAVVGWYHSHPDAPAWPSPYDLQRAWPCYSYLILSVPPEGAPAARSWVRSEDGNDFLAEKLSVEEDA